MSQIKESPSIAPVLPTSKGRSYPQGQPKVQERPQQKRQPRQDRDRGGDHRVDEYA